MKKIIPLILLCSAFNAHTQTQIADSLLRVLPLSTDTQKTRVLNNLCWEFAFSEPEKGKQFGYEALAYSQKIGYIKGQATALNRLGVIYDVTGNYDSAIYCYLQAGVKYAKIQNLEGKAAAINNIGMLYAAHGNLSRALGNYFEAVRIFESLKDETNLASAFNNIGLVYTDLGKYHLALGYFSKAAAINLKNNKQRALASNYTNMGRVFHDLNNIDSSLYYFNQSIQLEKADNNIYGLSILYNNIAIVYREQKQPQKALDYLLEALRLKRQLNDQTGEASTLLNIGTEYKNHGNDRLHEKYFLESHALATKINSYRIMRKTAQILMELYTKKKQYEKAIWYGQIMNIARDSVLNEESSKQIAELEARYKNEKQALEIEKTNLALTNANLEITQNRNTILLLVIGCVSVISIGFGVYKRHKHLQQRKFDAQLLQEQEQRNKAIIEAEEKERFRIARELHDGIGQQLSAAKMNMSAFESTVEEKDKDSYNLLMQLVDDAVKEVRSVSHNMMPNALIRLGLVSAVRDFINKLSSSSSLKIDLSIVGLNERLEPTTESVIYRLLQESISNIIKHSGATMVSIQLIKHHNRLNMVIEDNGKGFDTTLYMQAEGIGLKNMVSRVQFLNGSIDFDSTPGKGTTVLIDIPTL